MNKLEEFRERMKALFAAKPGLAAMPVPSDAELREMQARGELPADDDLERLVRGE